MAPAALAALGLAYLLFGAPEMRAGTPLLLQGMLIAPAVILPIVVGVSILMPGPLFTLTHGRLSPQTGD